SKKRIIRLRIRVCEQRHIVEDVAPLEQLLRAHGAPLEYVPGRPQTEITTVYFDTPEGTWSRGLSQTKFRARSYQDTELWWFEVKRREGSQVDKWRRSLSLDGLSVMLAGPRKWKPIKRVVGQQVLMPEFVVRCRRTAFEWPG